MLALKSNKKNCIKFSHSFIFISHYIILYFILCLLLLLFPLKHLLQLIFLLPFHALVIKRTRKERDRKRTKNVGTINKKFILFMLSKLIYLSWMRTWNVNLCQASKTVYNFFSWLLKVVLKTNFTYVLPNEFFMT